MLDNSERAECDAGDLDGLAGAEIQAGEGKDIEQRGCTDVKVDEEGGREIPLLSEQRAQFQAANHAEIDCSECVYMVPTLWLDVFLDENLLDDVDLSEAMRMIGPIDTRSMLVDADNPNVLLHDPSCDYSHQCYSAVSSNAWHMVVAWYGLASNGSVPVPRRIIRASNRQPARIEYHIPRFMLRKLQAGPLIKINSPSPQHQLMVDNQYVHFSASRTAGELYDCILQFVKLHFDTDKLRIWHVEDQNIGPLFLNLTAFKRLRYKRLVGKSNRTLADLGITGGCLLLEINDCKGAFPTESLQKKLQSAAPDSEDSDSLGAIPPEPADGAKGLTNLGNTCYMNSALQCLVHVPELANYFFHNIHHKELNAVNPLGSGGRIASSFGALVHQLFAAKGKKLFAPREFKAVIGHFNSMFSGHQQQDSQEFLAFLLDGLHEDLNRIVNKPYTEKPELSPELTGNATEVRKLADSCWENHKLRNDSVVLDLFVGLYKSTLKCPICSNVSLTFDPFSDLTLPIPTYTKWHHQVHILEDNDNTTVKVLEVELSKTATFEDLKFEVAKKTCLDVDQLYGFEIFQNQFYRNFQDAELLNDSKFLPIGDLIAAEDTIVFYELKDLEKTSVVVPIINTVKEEGFNASNPFGIPFFIKLNDQDIRSFGSIREKIESRYSSLTTYNYFSLIRKNTNKRKRKFFKNEDFPQIEKLFAENGMELKKFKRSNGENDDGLDNSEVVVVDKTDNINSNIDNVKSNIDNVNNYDKPDDTNNNTNHNNIPNNHFNTVNGNGSINKDHTIHDIVDEDSDFELVSGSSITDSQPDHVNDPEYDSDISIANPDLSSNYAFQIKLVNQNNRNHGLNAQNMVWTPYTNGRFSNLPNLIDKLPLAKRLFYSYSADDYNELDSASSDSVDDVAPKEDVQTYLHLSGSEGAGSTFGVIHEDDAASTMSGENQMDTLFSDKESISDKVSNNKMLADSGFSKPLSDNVFDKSKFDNHPTLVEIGDALVCEWDRNLYDVFFSGNEEEGGQSTWDHPEVVANPELEESKRKLQEAKSKNLTLKDCLDTFSKPEILGQNDLWYCPTCKEHRNAEKKIEIWSMPDILTIHLKRFENQRRFSDKIDAVIEFPIEELDMSQFISSEARHETASIYDLFAVDNHYGGLGGGHYTAYAKNFVDNSWYYYDDSSVTPANPERAVAGSAYLLFYRKRSVDLLGGDKFKQLLKDAREEEESNLKKQKAEELKAIQDIMAQISQEHLDDSESVSLETSPEADLFKIVGDAVGDAAGSDLALSDGEMSSYSASINPPS